MSDIHGTREELVAMIVAQGQEIAITRERDERLESALERCRTVLGNMALENEEHPTMGYLFKVRWPINHEPLRADARGLLPVIEEALSDRPAPAPIATETNQSPAKDERC